MKTVYKYILPVADEARVSMPAFAEVLTVGVQGENICVWALVDPKIPSLKKTFRIAGTGHPITDDGKWKFLGTVFLYEGTLVFHIFECDPKQELPS